MMARGYLGKISAVVAVNTSNASRQLTASAKDFKSYASKIDNAIGGAVRRAGKSFDELLTPLQKFQRALKIGAGQELKLVNQQQVQAFRQLVEAADRIAKPVAQAAKDFAGLSTQVQRGFLPALESAQKSAQQLLGDIDSGAKVSERSFANLEARITRVTQATSRLREAGQAASGLASGQELRFQQPGFVQQSARAAALQQQAASLTPDQIRGGGVAALVGQQRQAAQEAANLLSTLERIRITRNGDAQAAEAAYNRQVAGLREINDQLEQEITLSRQAAAATQQLADAQNRFADAERDRRSGATARRNANAFEDATAGVMERQRPTVSGFGPVVRTMESELARARALQEQFRALPAEAQRQLEEQKRRFDVVANGAEGGAVSLGVLAAASDRLEESLRGVNEQLDAQAAARQTAIDASGLLNIDQRETRLLDNEGRTSNAGSPTRRFTNAIGGEIGSVRRQLEELPGVAATLGPQVDNLTTRFQNLARTGVGTTAQQLQGVRNEIQAIQAAITSRGDIGQQFLGRFGGAGTAGLDLGIDTRSLNAVGSQIEFVQGRLAGLTAQQRGPAVAALEAYRIAAFRAYSGLEDNAERAAAEVARTRGELIRAAAAATGVSQGAFGRQFARVGDIARGAFGNIGLAVQQAAFAFEDFFSVTGGIDQRIRAAGNNISQLGFILGGTWGLGVGIAISVGTQFTLMLIDWYNEGRKTEDRLKSLNSTLEKQKNTVEQLAESYGKVAERIREAGQSESRRREDAIRKQVEEVRSRSQEAREQRILGASPEVQDARAAVAARERELGGTSTAAARIRAQLRLEQDRVRLREAERRAIAGGGRPGRDEIAGAVRRIAPQAGFLFSREQRDAALRAVNNLLNQAGDDPQAQLAVLRRARQTQASVSSSFLGRNIIAPDSEEILVALDQLIARLESSEQGSKIDRAILRITDNALKIADAMEAANADLQQAFEGVIGASAIEDEIAAFAESLAQLQKAAGEAAQAGRVEEARALNEDVKAIKAHIDALRDAAAAVKVFGSEFARLSASVASDVASLEQRAEQARREDIARGTPETAAARQRAEEDLQVARRRQREFEDRRASAVEQMEQDAVRRGDRRFGRIREIDAMLAVPANGTGADGTRGGTAEERRAAREERRRLQASIDEDVDNNPEVQAARRRRDRMTERAETAASADRGRELIKTPLQKAREESAQLALDVKNELDKRGAGRAERNAAFSNLALERAMQVAPMLMGFREERMNALLQGPSRAALNAADVNTMEGQRELNRLLRGDDPNKDVNLVEMQKQSELLQGVIDAIKQRDQDAIVEIRG